ncbi:MAG: DUF454 family protein [Planctomycetota bacterium]
MRQRLFLVLGLLNVVLGVVGLLLPLLPTTPFLLLAAFLFARSSDRMHRWLLTHRTLGSYVHAFRNKSGLSRKQKIRVAASFTVMLGMSAYFAPLPMVRVGVAALWFFWMVVLFRIKSTVEPTQQVWAAT